MSATGTKTRNHFANIFARLNDITHAEVERATPIGREVKKDDLIRFYSSMNPLYKR